VELLLAAGADVMLDPRAMGVTAMHLVAGGGADGTTWLAPLKGIQESDVAPVVRFEFQHFSQLFAPPLL
jgi:hypothetical protein